MSFSANNPWIKEREISLCGWKVDYNRGFISNMAPSLLTDFWGYSERQLAEYVQMIKSCGYTGMQINDGCCGWRYWGSWEPVYDKVRILSRLLHENGMKLTLWVWAAEFSSHGWHDDEAVYKNENPELPAYDDPKVYATFNKYYDIYAQLAPYVDRVIAHYYDPGRISDVGSVLKFAQLLFSKFRTANPQVKLGIDTWGCPDTFPQDLVNAGMSDVMLMELPFLPGWRAPGKRASFRQGVKDIGCELGSWGWYTVEYETDQTPMMCINDRVLADVYRQTREQADHVMVPSYWSEMDAYHVLNFFGLYAAGQLLIDPERNTDEIMDEAIKLVAGKKNAADLKIVIDYIRDARSGDTWNSYWGNEEEHIFKTFDYAPIHARSDEAVAAMERLVADRDSYGEVHLPISVHNLYRLMLPHVMQIKQHAQFRVDFAALIARKEGGASKEELQTLVDALPFEIKEYNAWIGLWGQPEARDAYAKVRQFCKDNGLKVPDRGVTKYHYKRRMYDHFVTIQRGKDYQKFNWNLCFENGLAFGAEYQAELIDEMVEEGLLVKREDGQVALADWETYRYDFNI